MPPIRTKAKQPPPTVACGFRDCHRHFVDEIAMNDHCHKEHMTFTAQDVAHFIVQELDDWKQSSSDRTSPQHDSEDDEEDVDEDEANGTFGDNDSESGSSAMYQDGILMDDRPPLCWRVIEKDSFPGSREPVKCYWKGCENMYKDHLEVNSHIHMDHIKYTEKNIGVILGLPSLYAKTDQAVEIMRRLRDDVGQRMPIKTECMTYEEKEDQEAQNVRCLLHRQSFKEIDLSEDAKIIKEEFGRLERAAQIEDRRVELNEDSQFDFLWRTRASLARTIIDALSVAYRNQGAAGSLSRHAARRLIRNLLNTGVNNTVVKLTATRSLVRQILHAILLGQAEEEERGDSDHIKILPGVTAREIRRFKYPSRCHLMENTRYKLPPIKRVSVRKPTGFWLKYKKGMEAYRCSVADCGRVGWSRQMINDHYRQRHLHMPY